MTLWLKQRLGVWLGASLLGGALLWNGGALRAQGFFDTASNSASENAQSDETGRPKLTRDEAAKEFANALSDPDISYSQFFERTSGISLKSQREVGKDAGYRAARLFRTMLIQWRQPNRTFRVQSEGDKTATVIVETDPTPPSRPLVLIEENGGWGVDLVETYAKWNGLEGAAKFEAIYKLTGVVLDGMPVSEPIRRRQCQMNLKQIALGIAQYVQDYDEKYPLAKPWVDVLQPYVRSEAIFVCPELPKGQKYGYAYNSKLSNKSLRQVAQSNLTVSLYETSVLKRNAYGMGENPAFRHDGGANYGFADGHIKWFAKGTTPSFNLKP